MDQCTPLYTFRKQNKTYKSYLVIPFIRVCKDIYVCKLSILRISEVNQSPTNRAFKTQNFPRLCLIFDKPKAGMPLY